MYPHISDSEEEAAMDVCVDGTIDADGALSVIVRNSALPPGLKKAMLVTRGKAKGLIRASVANGGGETNFDVIDDSDTDIGSIQVEHGAGAGLIAAFYWFKSNPANFTTMANLAAAMQAEIT